MVGVRNDDSAVLGRALGGRRARLALVRLALADRPLTAHELAATIWADELPATWDVALRGVIRGLRSSCAPVGGGDQALIATVPTGYQLADGVEVDLKLADAAATRAATLIDDGRYAPAMELLTPWLELAGSQLLAGEDGVWLTAHRTAVDEAGARGRRLLAHAATLAGEHERAVAVARRSVELQPLDESTHRLLIVALSAAGDRSGAVQAYEHCRILLAEQLGIDPSPDTVEVYLAGLRDQPGQRMARVPSETSSFIGRADEVAALADLVAAPGLISVLGTGGVGKSRLAGRVASGPHLAGARLWVPLAGVAQDALVASTVALALGVPLGADDPEQAVADHLAALGRVLLVLDGCEVVLDGVASLVQVVRPIAPLLTVLVTSRRELGLDGEQVLTIEPLPGPTGLDEDALLASGPVQLLLDRVRDGGGELALTARAMPHIADLVQRCGGLPLALELVAGQLAAMPPGDLIDHLAAVAGEVAEDGLRGVARSSYLLLDDDEAAVFRQLGVLDGPVGLPLIRAVVSIPQVRVVRILRELAARGLVSVDRSGPHWRYQQDDDLHRLARELLAEQHDEHRAFSRLADGIRALLPEEARAAPGSYQDAVTDVLGSIRSLFAAALTGAAASDQALELAFRLHRYFAANNVAEGQFWLRRLLAVAPTCEWTPYATFALGYLSYWAGDSDDAMRELDRVVGMLDGRQSPYLARALIFLGGLLDDMDRGPEAVECVQRSIAACGPNDFDLQVAARMGLGSVLAERVDPSAAGYAQDAIELCRTAGSPEQLALALPTAAMVCWQVGALDDARGYIAEARPMHRDTRRIARVVLLSTMASVALAEGDTAAAVDHGRSADREGTELGIEREMPHARSMLAQALLAVGDLSGAVDRSLAAVRSANELAFNFPLAIALETAVLVGLEAGLSRVELGILLATADRIRTRGDRPISAPLRSMRDGLDGALGVGGTPVAPDAAAQLAIRLLTGVHA